MSYAPLTRAYGAFGNDVAPTPVVAPADTAMSASDYLGPLLFVGLAVLGIGYLLSSRPSMRANGRRRGRGRGRGRGKRRGWGRRGRSFRSRGRSRRRGRGRSRSRGRGRGRGRGRSRRRARTWGRKRRGGGRRRRSSWSKRRSSYVSRRARAWGPSGDKWRGIKRRRVNYKGGSAHAGWAHGKGGGGWDAASGKGSFAAETHAMTPNRRRSRRRSRRW